MYERIVIEAWKLVWLAYKAGLLPTVSVFANGFSSLFNIMQVPNIARPDNFLPVAVPVAVGRC